jgi:O-antigen ligase
VFHEKAEANNRYCAAMTLPADVLRRHDSDRPRILLAQALAASVAAAATCLLDFRWQGAIPVISSALLLGVLGPQIVLACMVLFAGVNLGFLTGYAPALFSAGGGTSFEGLRLLVLLGAFVVVSARMPTIFRDLRIVTPYLAFVSFAVVSLSWSPAISHGARDVIKLAYPLGGFLLTLFVIRREGAESVERMVAIGALLGSLSHVIVRLLGMSTFEHFEGRYYGGWHPNVMAMFCVATGVPLLLWGLARKRPWFVAIAALMFMQLVLTGSRTMFLSAAAGLVVGLLLLKRRQLLLIATAAAMLTWVIVPTLGERSQTLSMVDVGAPSLGPLQNFSGRLLLWADVWTSLVPGHEVAGQGLGASAAYLQGRYLVGKHVHNEYLETFADLGAIGLALLLLWLSWMVLPVVKTLRSAEAPQGHRVAFVALATSFLVSSVMENTLAPAAEYTVFLWVAFALALRSQPAT